MYPKAKNHAEIAERNLKDFGRQANTHAQLAIYEQLRCLTQVMESINNTLKKK